MVKPEKNQRWCISWFDWSGSICLMVWSWFDPPYFGGSTSRSPQCHPMSVCWLWPHLMALWSLDQDGCHRNWEADSPHGIMWFSPISCYSIDWYRIIPYIIIINQNGIVLLGKIEGAGGISVTYIIQHLSISCWMGGTPYFIHQPVGHELWLSPMYWFVQTPIQSSTNHHVSVLSTYIPIIFDG